MDNQGDALDVMPVSPHPRLTRWAYRGWFTIVVGFLYLPIVFMIAFSFNDSRTPGLPITGLTLHWYEEMLGNGLLHQAVLNSVIVALVVAILATTIGTMTAYGIVRGGFPHPNGARLLLTMPIMLPGVLIGLALLILFSRVMHVPLSLGTVVAGHLVFAIPFATLIIAARLQGFDRALEWAAADLGAPPGVVFRRIVLPLLSPAILAAALISVTMSIDEFIITFFTIGPQLTLPLYIYTQIKFGVTPEVNAVATMLLLAMLLVLFAAASAGRLRQERGA